MSTTTTVDRPATRGRARTADLPTTEVRFVHVADRRYLAVDGVGMPDTGPEPTQAFREAIEALYGVG
jgi:hypothetical protein